MPPQQPTLTLEVNKGTAIKLPGAASTVFVAAPDIADVQVKSPSMVYVFAKKPGSLIAVPLLISRPAQSREP